MTSNQIKLLIAENPHKKHVHQPPQSIESKLAKYPHHDGVSNDHEKKSTEIC